MRLRRTANFEKSIVAACALTTFSANTIFPYLGDAQRLSLHCGSLGEIV
jgi:hypothetical protein